MTRRIDPATTLIYHITDVANLPSILAKGGLHSDVAMAARDREVIGYGHIKERRMKKIRVPCCGNRFVGEFVPFYFCPRSPMLFTIDKGATGRQPGCQRSIVHLISTVQTALDTGQDWAISDGNAGAFHTWFYADLAALDALDWMAIRSTSWRDKTHQKSAEFLVADFFPWAAIQRIGCHNLEIAQQTRELLRSQDHMPSVEVKSDWYY